MKLLVMKCHTAQWVEDIVHSLITNIAKARVNRFDFDILFTTDSDCVVGHTFIERGENGNGDAINVTAYDVPKPEGRPRLTDDDLFTSDTFSFGQQIGQLTNLSTAMYAMIPMFPKGSKERTMLENRIQQTCVGQSKQIDKTKIGKPVKCIPNMWVDRQKIEDTDSDEVKEKKEFYNRIRISKKPYFFKYNYNSFKQDIRKFKETQNKRSLENYMRPLEDLIYCYEHDASLLSEDEKRSVEYYYDHNPAIETPCNMNVLCKYIESVDFQIKNKIRSTGDFDYKKLFWYKDDEDRRQRRVRIDKAKYEEVKSVYRAEMLNLFERKKTDYVSKKKKENGFVVVSNKLFEESWDSCCSGEPRKPGENSKEAAYKAIRKSLLKVVGNIRELSNYMVMYFYTERPSEEKSMMWSLFGRQLFENIVDNVAYEEDGYYYVYFPVNDKRAERVERDEGEVETEAGAEVCRSGDKSNKINFLFESYSIEPCRVKKRVVDESIYNNAESYDFVEDVADDESVSDTTDDEDIDEKEVLS